MIIRVNQDTYEENYRLDSFLADYLEDYSRSELSKLIRAEKVLVNERPAKTSYHLKLNDSIELHLEDLEIEEIIAQDIYLEVLYEDDDLAIINKPIGMLSHPTANIRSNTLVNALMYRFDKLSDINGLDRLGIVHRLDYNTSGLMIICKTNLAAESIKEDFMDRSIEKRYRAIVNGYLEEKEADLVFPIARSLSNRKLMTVREDGKYAWTSYKVLMENEGFSYLDLTLHTGRTHQIRVHLAHINHPILGDKDYGGKKSQFSIDHQLLQAYYLKFIHPISNTELEFTLEESSEIKKYRKIIFKEP